MLCVGGRTSLEPEAHSEVSYEGKDRWSRESQNGALSGLVRIAHDVQDAQH